MIGHTNARQQLEKHLPPATLLYGPASVGKWTLAEHIADHHGVLAVDRWHIKNKFTVDTAKLINRYAARAPHGRFKLVIARLDDAKDAALNAMLKTLEEPPPTVKFIFTTTRPVLSTITSRCTTYELGRLTVNQLERLYRDQGMSIAKAARAASYAQGQVERGYAVDSDREHVDRVRALVKALDTGDREGFFAATHEWDTHSGNLLVTLLTECCTRNYRVFTEADGYFLSTDRNRLWQVVEALGSHARPRLGVRAALTPFLNRR